MYCTVKRIRVKNNALGPSIFGNNILHLQACGCHRVQSGVLRSQNWWTHDVSYCAQNNTRNMSDEYTSSCLSFRGVAEIRLIPHTIHRMACDSLAGIGCGLSTFSTASNMHDSIALDLPIIFRDILTLDSQVSNEIGKER